MSKEGIVYLLTIWNIHRYAWWLNLIGDAISFCSNTCIYSTCTNLEINK